MSLPEVIEALLESNGIQYELLESEQCSSFYEDAKQLKIPLHELVRGIVIESLGQKRMLILRAEDLLDFASLNTIYGNSINIVANYQTLIVGCEAESRIPVPAIQNIEIVADKAVLNSDVIYIDAGIKGSYLRLSGEDFRGLNESATLGEFSCSAEKLQSIVRNDESETSNLKSITPLRIQQRVQETLDLPAMPVIAQEVMRLRVDPKAGASELSKIVSQDPSLSAQVISWANSPYYGYQGKINSIETAISRVLGFDLVLNLVLGISVGKSLYVPTDGPIGLQAYWRQSVYCATLSEKLCSFISGKNRPQRGLVYLSGLLHNFGQLLLGHLFPPQFYLINSYVAMNPHIPVVDIERYLLGISHVEVGALLMESWNMPSELTEAVRF
ncbi:MAG: HDOD domain-containing protein, partial [Gammaproteobacteria bacterium]|nr:HDOD domain-containing protein [Gammaproteobacteria bacterium]